MLRQIIILLFIGHAGIVSGQSIFESIFINTSNQGQAGAMTEITGLIINNDCCTTTKFLQHVTSWTMPSDWAWSQCTPDICLPTGDSLGFFYLGPSDTGQVALRFYVGNTTGTGEINIRFSDRDNLSDFEDINFSVLSSGVNTPNEIANILIYPNPVQDRLNIIGNLKSAKIEITDLRGRKVLCSLLSQPSIDVSQLKPGVYNLMIEERQNKFFKRILVN